MLACSGGGLQSGLRNDARVQSPTPQIRTTTLVTCISFQVISWRFSIHRDFFSVWHDTATTPHPWNSTHWPTMYH